MWLDVLILVLATGAVAFFSVFLYRLGVRDGKKPETVFKPMVEIHPKHMEEPPEVKKLKNVMHNIENYGSGKRQVKIND